MGVFVAVLLVVALHHSGAGSRRSRPRPPLLQSPLFTIHVVSMLFAYASFALACVLGVTYVLLFKEIKAKHLGFFYARLPSLQVLDVDERARRHGRLGVPDAGGRRRRHLGDPGAGARPIRARAGDVARAIRRSWSRCSRGGCTRSRSSRGGRSAGAAGGRRGCRRSRS